MRNNLYKKSEMHKIFKYCPEIIRYFLFHTILEESVPAHMGKRAVPRRENSIEQFNQ